MEYTLANTYEYVLELLDKKGSDFIQMPDMMRVFKTATLDFIGERIPVIEKTQQVTSDLLPLMDTKKFNVLDDPDDSYVKLASIPSYVHHLVIARPLYKGNVTARRPRLIRHGNLDALMADPNNRPTIEYPLILQYMDYVKIHSGFDEKPLSVFFTYIKKPTFAELNLPDDQIVNMPDSAIEDIINKVVVSLSVTRADERAQANMIKEQSFRNDKK